MTIRFPSIKTKLMIAIVGTSLIVLVAACTVFITFEVVTFRRNLARSLATRADLVAANSTAALAFQNQQDASRILSAFRSDPRMEAACLYDAQGKVFATYPPHAPAGTFPQHVEIGHRFKNGAFVIFTPVVEDGRRLGTVFLKFNLSALTDRYRAYTLLVVLIVIGSILVAFGLSEWMQKRIAEPLLKLAETARTISRSNDYSLRAQALSEDEIGLLTDSFNTMLDEIQQRDASLRQSEARTRAILESALDSIITIDHEGRILEYNPAAERTFGYHRSDVVGKDMVELLIPRRLREKYQQELQKYFRANQAPLLGKRIELIALRADGAEFPVEASITRIGTGERQIFTGFIRDITERKQAERTTALLAAVVQSSDDAIITKDLNSVILSWNKGAEQIFGYTATEAVGHSILFLTPDERQQEETEMIEKILRGESVEHFDTVRLRKDGTMLDVSVTVSPIRDASGRIIAASNISRDITARVRAEQEIRKLNAELEQRVLQRTAELEVSNKELEAFSYSVSHDLRAPLRAIDGFSQSLLEEYGNKLETEARHQLERVRVGAKRMGTLIDDLLKLSRITCAEMRREQVNLSSIARQVAAELKLSEPERKVTFVIEEGMKVQGDAQLLYVVMDNLLRNSWKYTSKHPTARIEFGSLKQNGARVYFVRDDGAGFDMSHGDLLFAPFQRLHRQTEFEGTGIGLATVQRIVRRHGGRTWAEGAVEKGATFYFTL
ncbi:MAG TPA: PAS domain S-box protein [Verrucomicrobiae bacterium]|nr:PAS domain S-box protein [Verrucomicrobiae bacterium]